MKNTFSTTYRRPSLLPDNEQRSKLWRKRRLADYLTRTGIGIAGITVVLALAGLFIYLFSEAAALFSPVSVTQRASYTLPLHDNEKPLHIAIGSHNETGMLLTDNGRVRFFTLADGTAVAEQTVPLPDGSRISAVVQTGGGLLALATDNGYVLLIQSQQSAIQNHQPALQYPLGKKAWKLHEDDAAIRTLSLQQRGDHILLATLADEQLMLHAFRQSSSLLVSGDWQLSRYNVAAVPPAVKSIALDGGLRHLYLLDQHGVMHQYGGHFEQGLQPFFSTRLVEPAQHIQQLQWLAGANSLVVAGSGATLSQWFPVRNADNQWPLSYIRNFETGNGAITHMAAESARRVFLTFTDQAQLALYHASSGKTLYRETLALTEKPQWLAFAPSGSALWLVAESGLAQWYVIENRHPDVSWKTLWQRIWYEGREQPEFVWQSSSASDVFEPKLSLLPLMSGTLKAAFFAMLFAVPLAIMAAVYSAYFISPALRGKVKPAIEMMEAMPTVILGFLAGLWLAPFAEQHLPALIAVLVLLPAVVLLVSLFWYYRPAFLRGVNINGREALLLLPFIVLTGWLCVALSPLAEQWFFDGSMRQWLTDNGIGYQQRNALIIGIAMGFAIIPGIFSLADDAIFHVPRHLTQGSLALGANHWQTLWRVVLLTASPGIFSAVMIGFGRAIGETMIVLMATGNSPVLGFNPLEGMRTLAASIAMELPEATAGSSHFRLLLLAALLLFVITFVANTLAEWVRHNLRRRYNAMQAGV